MAATRFKWAMPRRGDVLGTWRLKDLLGEGGNAFVWRAEHVDTGDTVAIKVLKPPERGERYARFVAEVETCRDVASGHVNVLPVLDAVLPTGEEITSPPWFAMPVATPLTDHLGLSPTADEVVDALIPVAIALNDLLEQHGISHRDIKPENLYWHYDGPAIGDFGLVELPHSAGLTREDRDLGPRLTLPPEMRAGQPARLGPPADVYELAMTIFALLTGDAPPGGLRSDEPSHSLAHRMQRPDLDELDRVLRRATQYDPTKRPTMREFAQDLAAWRSPPAPPGAADLRRHRARFATLRARSAANDEARSAWDAKAQNLFSALYDRARATFDSMQALGLENHSARGEFVDGIDALGRPVRSASYVGLQPPGADGAVWIAAVISWGWQDIGTMYVTAAWMVAPFDAWPEVVWSSSVNADPESLADTRQAENLIDEWAREADTALDRFGNEAERYGEAGAPNITLGDSEPPELLELSFVATPIDREGRRKITASARLRSGRAGVAGAGYSSSHSQLRFVGPGGEILTLMFSAHGNRVSGTVLDGFYESSTWIEPYHPPGPWRAEHFLLVDQAGHSVHLAAPQLAERWFPVEVQTD
jgi:Protein kinase domain